MQEACDCRSPEEPSYSRGAPEVPEPLALGAQYLTRKNTWKNFVYATRPAALDIVCTSPKRRSTIEVHPNISEASLKGLHTSPET